MSEVGTLTKSRVYLARVDQFRLPELLALDGQAPPPCCSREEFLVACRSDGAGVAVAETDGRIIGFALYRSTPPSGLPRPGPVVRLLHWCGTWMTGLPFAPQVVELLRIGVLPDWRRQGIGRALLQAIHEECRPGRGCIRATVPESNLPVQLLLRDAGYRAFRILRSHYGSEDGYLMERRGG